MSGQMLPVTPGEPSKARKLPPLVVYGAAAVAVILAFLAVSWGLRTLTSRGDKPARASHAAVGQCLTSAAEPQNMEIIDCAKPDAKHKVVGVLEERTEAQARDDCARFDGAQTFVLLFLGAKTETTKGKLLCLAPASP